MIIYGLWTRLHTVARCPTGCLSDREGHRYVRSMSIPHVPGLPERFKVVREIARGGMGRVWLAQDFKLDRQVALKEIIASAIGPAAVGDEVLREARAAARVHHPNVTQVFDVLDEVVPNPLIVMEYVAGRSLAELLSEKGVLPVQQTASIGLRVLAALRAAHSRRVFHRDVKPGNILIGDDGRIMLTDFGIAKVIDVSADHRSVHFRGTLEYSAPERFRNAPASAAADLWSLGVTLYVCLTGRRSPFARESDAATMLAVLHDDPLLPRSGSLLGPLLEGLLQKDPRRRITSAAAERMLRAAAASLQPTRVMDVHPTMTSPKRSRVPVAVGAVVVLLGAGGAAWWYNRPPSNPNLATVQAFAGKYKMSSCHVSPSRSTHQKAKWECDAGNGVKVYWILYYSAPERDEHRDKELGGCAQARCLTRDAVDPNGAEGHYVEFVNHNGADWWAGLWWDDGTSHPKGVTALEVHGPYDKRLKEPAAELRTLWKGWGYRFAGG
jgi:serine/threonine protein kinase